MDFDSAFRQTLKSKSANTKKGIKVIIFCDPGVDDALMLLQMLSSAHFQVVGIVSVTGNASCYQTTQNTLDLCEYVGKSDIAVYPGSMYKKLEKPETISIYGKSGLGSLVLPKAKKMRIQSQNGIEFTKASLKREKHLLISTASLLELAKVFKELEKEQPSALHNVIAISMMAGVINAVQDANWPIAKKRYSEANLAYHVKSSKIVFDCCATHKIPIFLSPLDLTHSLLASETDIHRLKTAKNLAGKCAYRLMSKVPKHYQNYFGKGPNGKFRQPLHDLHASFCLLHPEVYTGQWVTLHLNTGLKPYQMNIVDQSKGNVFLLDMHYAMRARYFTLYEDDLKNLKGVS